MPAPSPAQYALACAGVAVVVLVLCFYGPIAFSAGDGGIRNLAGLCACEDRQWASPSPLTGNATRTRARFLVAVIAGPGDRGFRDAMRETILKPRPPVVVERAARDGTPGKRENVSEVDFVYRFLVGTNGGIGEGHLAWLLECEDKHADSISTAQRKRRDELPALEREMAEFKDIVSMPLFDHKNLLTYKRLLSFEWAHKQTLVDEYDFFLMMDTDTYVRFDNLYRTMRDGLQSATTEPLTRQEMQDRVLFHGGWPWFEYVPNYGGPYKYFAGPAIVYSPLLVRMHSVRANELPTLVPYPGDDTATGMWLERLKDKRLYTDLYLDPQKFVRKENMARQVHVMTVMPPLPDLSNTTSMLSSKWTSDEWDTVHKVMPDDFRAIYLREQSEHNRGRIGNIIELYP